MHPFLRLAIPWFTLAAGIGAWILLTVGCLLFVVNLDAPRGQGILQLTGYFGAGIVLCAFALATKDAITTSALPGIRRAADRIAMVYIFIAILWVCWSVANWVWSKLAL